TVKPLTSSSARASRTSSSLKGLMMAVICFMVTRTSNLKRIFGSARQGRTMTFCCQTQAQAQVATGRRLEQTQAKLRQHSQNVVKNIALDALVVHPGGFIGKAIHLDRNTVRRGLHHAHHLNHVLMNFRVTLDISHAVSAEGAQVGQATVIDRIQTGTAQLLVGALQIFFFVVQVIAQQGKARQAIDFCWSQKSNAGGIDAQGALDTTAARDRKSVV